jgi:hypothetical protein
MTIIKHVLNNFNWNNEMTLTYDKPNQQGMAAFNERKPNTTQQHESVEGSPGRPKQKQDRA